MTLSTEDPSTRPLVQADKDRPAHEVLVAVLFGPLGRLLVQLLLPLRVPPPAVVLANVAAGLSAAVALGRGQLVLAAALLQVKTVLDNADGLLARASGRVTLLGRYLDTEADLVVNALLFAALGAQTGEGWLALAAFCAVTFLLSVDFNFSELHRAAHGREGPAPARTGSPVERMLEGIYRVVFAPQDRGLRGLSERRFARVVEGSADPDARHRAELAYHDRFSLAYLANTGLSTQLAVLGACLLAGSPTAYLWLTVLAVVPLPLLQLRRERLAGRALRGAA